MHIPLLLLLACTGNDPTDSGLHDSGLHDSGSHDGGSDGGADSGAPAELEIQGINLLIRNALSASLASGAQVAVWHQGRVAYTGNFGSAHPDEEQEILDTTLFQIGSIQKHLTSALALVQVDKGTLSLDDHPHDVIGDWELDDDPSWSHTATLHDLLAHRGGLFDYIDLDSQTTDSQLLDLTRGEIVAALYPMAPADAFYNYANPNFSIAGAMNEVAGGQPWADLLQADLLEPLGMTRTFARKADVITDGDHAAGTGYLGWEDLPLNDPIIDADIELGTVEVDQSWESAWSRPAGLIWSTAADMASFEGFVMNGDPAVLDDDLHQQLSTSHGRVYPEWDFIGYGYGLLVYDGWSSSSGWQSTPLLMHDGSTDAYGSAVVMLPEYDTAVVILANGAGAAFLGEAIEIAMQVAEVPAGGSTPSGLFDPPDDLAPYTGTWHDPHGVGTVAITQDGSALRIAMPDVEAAGFTVGDSLTFQLPGVYGVNIDGSVFPLTFWDGADGTVNAHLAHRRFVAHAVQDPKLPLATPTRAQIGRALATSPLDRPLPLIVRP